MIAIPLPMVVVLALVFGLLRLLSEERRWTPTRAAFASLLVLGIVHGTLSTLVWSYGMTLPRLFMPIIASLLPVAVWLAFRTMTQSAGWPPAGQLAAHLAPTVLIAALSPFGSVLIDLTLIASFVVHGVLLLQMAAAGPDGFQAARLQRSLSAVVRAARIGGALLIANAAIDVAIIVDFQRTGGQYVPTILAGLSVVMLLLLAGVAASGSDAAVEEDDADAAPGTLPKTGDHLALLERLDTLMRSAKLYTDPDLTLRKIARRMGVPARDVSTAINRHHGMNVSQYVNGLRLDEACRKLATTDEAITTIHLDAGFQTKSNFNREFRRQLGCSPTEFRAARRSA